MGCPNSLSLHRRRSGNRPWTRLTLRRGLRSWQEAQGLYNPKLRASPSVNGWLPTPCSWQMSPGLLINLLCPSRSLQQTLQSSRRVFRRRMDPSTWVAQAHTCIHRENWKSIRKHKTQKESKLKTIEREKRNPPKKRKRRRKKEEESSSLFATRPSLTRCCWKPWPCYHASARELRCYQLCWTTLRLASEQSGLRTP